ncbi:MAG: hypothetical protein GX062_04705 [Firmicutes bacterium]|nr:hypothetical protein [Bacillota bacterium]
MFTPALLVNLRTHLSQAGDTKLTGDSLIIVEFFGSPTVSTQEVGLNLSLSFSGAELNMPAGTYNIYDSLVNRVVLQQLDDTVHLTVERDLAAPWELREEIGAVHRFHLHLFPTPLQEIFTGRIVRLDPLARPGAYSPTRLPEAVPTRDIAQRLARLLAAAGARPHQNNNWSGLPSLSLKDIWSGRRCDVVLGIATLLNPKRPCSGLGLRYRAGDPASLRLAQILRAEIERKLPLPLLSFCNTGSQLLGASPVPGVVAEVGCLSHRVDEGMLRDIDHKQKLAQTLFNGLKHFFAERRM